MKRIALLFLFLLCVALPVRALGQEKLGQENNGCGTDVAICADGTRGGPDDGENRIPPKFDPRGPYTLAAGESLALGIHATGQEDNRRSLIYSALSLPSGAR